MFIFPLLLIVVFLLVVQIFFIWLVKRICFSAEVCVFHVEYSRVFVEKNIWHADDAANNHKGKCCCCHPIITIIASQKCAPRRAPARENASKRTRRLHDVRRIRARKWRSHRVRRNGVRGTWHHALRS